MKQKLATTLLSFFTLVILATPIFAQTTAEEYFEASQTRLRDRNLPGAIAALDKAIELKPDFARAYLQRGRLHLMQGAVDATLADFDKALLIDPDLAEAYAERAMLRRMKNNDSGALSDLDNAIVRGVRSDMIYSERSSLRMMAGDLKGALTDAEAAISINPNRIGNYLSRAAARRATGNDDGALADYNYIIDRFEKKETERLAAGKPERTAPPFDLTSPVISSERPAISNPEGPGTPDAPKGAKPLRAVPFMEGQAVIKLEPGMTPEQMEYLPNVGGAYMSRAQIHKKKGDSKAAIEDLTESIKIFPFFGAYSDRARELRQAGDLNGAIADFSKAIELAPNMAPFYLDRAMTYLEMNRDEEAEKDFAQALTLNPGLQSTIESRRAEMKGKREKKP